ncbi:MAG: DNA polymerase, partial [Candidatus Thorarchaeota archaeon]
LERYKIYGWKVTEEALETLPDNAPEGSRHLATWLSLEGRRADLEEWCAAYNEHSGRIHGTFSGLGSWTGRMAHKQPNQGNIFRTFYLGQCKGEVPSPVEDVKLRFNGVLRSLWRAEPGRYLVGADAEGIQLRVLAHEINDPDYRKIIESGVKEDKTDIHNVNMRSLYPYCRSRDDAKTYIYAWVLNAAAAKIAEILGCTLKEAKQAMDMFLGANPALKEHKLFTIPSIAERGFFVGLDGRKVIVPNAHKVLAGQLQNGESTIMKHATILWRKWAKEDGLRYKAVDLVHDEWQNEAYEMEEAHRLGQLKCDALIKTGQELGVRCALRGEYNIGINWLETH